MSSTAEISAFHAPLSEFQISGRNNYDLLTIYKY